MSTALFNADQYAPQACPHGHCQAIKFAGQDKAVTCAHDLDPERNKRPKHCLNAHDPSTAPLPEGY